MILFFSVFLVIDGFWSLITKHNRHYPECPWFVEAGRIFRTIIGGVLIAAAIVLRFQYGVAWADQPSKTGTASWYDYESCRKEGTSGRFTASGERFNPDDMTCASWEHKIGTLLRVTNIRTGQSIIVRVNDRGPSRRLYRNGRIIDLSRGAFRRLASLHSGVIRIKVEKI